MRFMMAATALVLSTGVAFAQGTTPSTTNTSPAMPLATTSGATASGSGMSRQGMTNSTTPGSQTPAATVNPNAQSTNSPSPSAVQTNNTTARTSAAPVPGRNSFTMGEARRRITAAGFSGVKDLKKDDQGIWRGMAMKDSATVNVALDYQGNVVGK